MKFFKGILTTIDWVAIVVCFMVVFGAVGAAVVGAVRNIWRIERLYWRTAGVEEIIIWSIIALSFVWVALRWKRLNKRP